MITKFNGVFGVCAMVFAMNNTAWAQEAPKPCFGVYCLADNADDFIALIPEDVDYQIGDAVSTRIVYVRKPIIINGQNFEILFLDQRKNSTQSLRAKYKYTPRDAGNCIERYEQLLDFGAEIGIDTKPKTEKSTKQVKRKTYKTDGGIRYTLGRSNYFSSSLSTNKAIREDLGYNVSIGLEDKSGEDLSYCAISIAYWVKE